MQQKNKCLVCNAKAILCCLNCGQVFFCSATCALKTFHPCELINSLQQDMRPKNRWNLNQNTALFLSQLYLNIIPLSMPMLTLMFERKIRGNRVLALWRHSQELDIWPDRAHYRQNWLKRNISYAKHSFLSNEELLNWSYTHLDQGLIVLQAFTKSYSNQILASIPITEIWRFVFYNELRFLFFFEVVSNASEKTKQLFLALESLEIPYTLGRDLFLFGPTILPSVSFSSYTLSCVISWFQTLPRGKSLYYNRTLWTKARECLICWEKRRQLLLGILSA